MSPSTEASGLNSKIAFGPGGQDSLRVPFNSPGVVGKELEYVAEAVQNLHLAGDGPFTKKCSALIEEITGAKKVLLTTSCTHALDMAAHLLDIQAGDEVIVPSFTFVSTANAFVLRGAVPIFVDVRRDTFNLDEARLKEAISPRTRAIVPVHYAGVGCEMDEIVSLAREYDIPIVEDNAHGLFGKYRGQPLGTFGKMATLSFHETKNVSCGEGGALLINDERYSERAEIIREKGTDRSRFFRGEVDKYSWVDIGSSYLPSDLLAAFLYGQLEVSDRTQERRRILWERYHSELTDWSNRTQIRLPVVPPHCDQAYHMFYVVTRSLYQREALTKYLKARGISAVFHYLPLHLSEFGSRFLTQSGQCPVTEAVSDCLLRLPFHSMFTDAEQDSVIEALHDFASDFR